MKAVIYARVSSREQEKEGFSIPAQLKLLQEYADKNGLTVSTTFTEAETAKSSGREQFNKMLDFLKSTKEPHCILVEKTDRLYRNFKDYVRLEELDVEIHLVKEGEILSKDAKSHEKFIHGIKVLMAKNYIDNLSEEVKKGQKEKAEQGHFPSVAPYGYKNNLETHLIEVHPETSTLVKRAFELYASQEFSLVTLRNKLFQEGFRYSSSLLRIPATSLERMLKNPIYIGDFYWAGKYYKGKHQPIVTVEHFEKVQSILQNRYKGQTTKREFQYTGLISCAVCGRAITAELKKNRYIYYHCSNKECSQRAKHVREEKLEQQFLALLKGIQIGKPDSEIVIKALKEHHAEEKVFHKESTSHVQAQLSKVQTKLDQIYEDKLEGIIPEELWRRKHQQYVEEQQKLLKTLEEHKRGSVSYIEMGIQLIELAEKALVLYEHQNFTNRRRLLRFISSNYLLEGENLSPVWNPAFEYFYKFRDFEKWRGGRGSNPRHPA